MYDVVHILLTLHYLLYALNYTCAYTCICLYMLYVIFQRVESNDMWTLHTNSGRQFCCHSNRPTDELKLISNSNSHSHGIRISSQIPSAEYSSAIQPEHICSF